MPLEYDPDAIAWRCDPVLGVIDPGLPWRYVSAPAEREDEDDPRMDEMLVHTWRVLVGWAIDMGANTWSALKSLEDRRDGIGSQAESLGGPIRDAEELVEAFEGGVWDFTVNLDGMELAYEAAFDELVFSATPDQAHEVAARLNRMIVERGYEPWVHDYGGRLPFRIPRQAADPVLRGRMKQVAWNLGLASLVTLCPQTGAGPEPPEHGLGYLWTERRRRHPLPWARRRASYLLLANPHGTAPGPYADVDLRPLTSGNLETIAAEGAFRRPGFAARLDPDPAQADHAQTWQSILQPRLADDEVVPLDMWLEQARKNTG